jgi:predicted RNase H-like HicB family nuclease
VTFADLPGCVSTGDDLAHALSRAQEALSLHISGMVEDGDPLPRPSTLDEAMEKEKFQAGADGCLLPEGTFCQYVVAETFPLKKLESPVRLSISLKGDIVKKIDELANEMGLSRSGLINVATREYLSRMQS